MLDCPYEWLLAIWDLLPGERLLCSLYTLQAQFGESFEMFVCRYIEKLFGSFRSTLKVLKSLGAGCPLLLV